MFIYHFVIDDETKNASRCKRYTWEYNTNNIEEKRLQQQDDNHVKKKQNV